VGLWLLGTAGAVPDAERDVVGLVVEAPGGLILVEAGSSPLHRLRRLGFDPLRLEGVFLSHGHPDHLSGLPLLLMGLWLLRRERPLWIAGPEAALARARALLELFDWGSWAGMFPVEWRPVPLRPGVPVGSVAGARLMAAPVVHSLPALGLRLELPEGSAAYSGDTEPCPAMVELARGVDVLLHEATGPYPGHTDPEVAGRVAQAAGAHRLILIHVPPGVDPAAWQAAAARVFDGIVEVGRDGMRVL